MDGVGHFPVLLDEVVGGLARGGERVLVDCTVGLGGHAAALLEAAGDEAVLIGIDLDEPNLLQTKKALARFGGRVRLFEANFADLPAVLAEAGVDAADAILADLGVASSQLDDPARGFSFQADGPLDMRYRRDGPTAADWVNTLGEAELADVFYRHGQERHSRRIARAIVRARGRERIERTGQLARIIASAMPGPRRRRRIHPATRCFMALRAALNAEAESLQKLLEAIDGALSVGGRAGIISFQSIEDRLVKRSFASLASAGTHRLVTPKPVRAGRAENERNPRSRSARLRIIERIR